MVRPLSRNAVSLLASTVAVAWAGASLAKPLEPDPAPGPERYLAHRLLNGVEGRVERLLPPMVIQAVDKLYVRGRALEYRQPFAWRNRALELRVRGGRLKGSRTRSYGLRLEVRF